jgi:hypothetical protein
VALFADGRCRICGGGFPAQRRAGHLEYHAELFDLYAPQRAERARRLHEREEDIGWRLVCETSGMPPHDRRKLDRHIARHGLVGVPTDGGMRVESAALAQDVALPWQTPRTRNLGMKVVRLRRRGLVPMAIADMIGKSDPVVRRYLREAKEAGLLAA